MADLAAAGIAVGIASAPIHSRLTSDIPELLERAKEPVQPCVRNMLRLPAARAIFEEQLPRNCRTKQIAS